VSLECGLSDAQPDTRPMGLVWLAVILYPVGIPAVKSVSGLWPGLWPHGRFLKHDGCPEHGHPRVVGA